MTNQQAENRKRHADPATWVATTGPDPRSCPCERFVPAETRPTVQDAYDAGVRDGIELAAETMRRQAILADTATCVSLGNVPEGTPGTSGSEDSPHDAAATAAGRGAVRDDNPSGGGTPGEWLERQPTSRPCTCGHPREHHSTLNTADNIPIGMECAVCQCQEYNPDPHECSPQRCCRHCKRHTTPHKGCMLR